MIHYTVKLVRKLTQLQGVLGEVGPKVFEARNLTSFVVVASCGSVLTDASLD
jgi:hypothetical protein